jgi:small subunit ribosomal protein S2
LPIVTVQELIDNGVHFGHRASRWNPKMAPFIHGKRNTVHIIDLRSTVRGLVRACHFLQRIASEGRDVLFVGTKRGAKAVVQATATNCGMPAVTERWLGGTLTNFETIRRRLVRLEELEAFENSDDFLAQRKKDIAKHHREVRKLTKNLGGIRKMSSLPGCLVVIDPRREAISVKEANRIGIPVVALLDTDCDPDVIDIAIPGNDDSMRSVETILRRLSEAVSLGAKSAKARGVQPAVAPGARDDALADSLRVAGSAGKGAKKVLVRRRTAPGEGGPGGGGGGRGGRGGPGGGRTGGPRTAAAPATAAPAAAAPATGAPAEPAGGAEPPAES